MKTMTQVGTGALVSLALLLGGCAVVPVEAAPGYSPEPSYRYVDGSRLVYDADLAVYLVVGYPGLYWWDHHYYRRDGGYWLWSPRRTGPWIKRPPEHLPGHLYRHHREEVRPPVRPSPDRRWDDHRDRTYGPDYRPAPTPRPSEHYRDEPRKPYVQPRPPQHDRDRFDEPRSHFGPNTGYRTTERPGTHSAPRQPWEKPQDDRTKPPHRVDVQREEPRKPHTAPRPPQHDRGQAHEPRDHSGPSMGHKPQAPTTTSTRSRSDVGKAPRSEPKPRPKPQDDQANPPPRDEQGWGKREGGLHPIQELWGDGEHSHH